jgi:hypothetical protein
MKILPALLAIAMFAPSVGPAAAASSARKCPRGTPVRFPNAPEYVYLLDGRSVGPEAIERVDHNTVESVQIICHDDLHRVFGVEAKYGGVVMFTAGGPSSTLRSTMESLAKLQEAHHAKTGAFARTLAELGWSDPTGLLTVSLSVTNDGTSWTATGRHRHLISTQLGFTVSGSKPS